MKTGFLALTVLAGLASAQQTSTSPASPQTAPAPRPHFRPGGPRGNLETHLTQALGLNAEQQNKVHTVLLERQVQTKGMAEQMRNLHTSLAAAVKAGNESLIDKTSLDIATLHQQQTAIHAKGIAKIYSALTPAQQAKVGPNLEMLMGGMGMPPGGPGPGGPGPRRRNGPPPPPAQQQ